MPVRSMHNTVTDRDVTRIKAYDDGADRKVHMYSDGTEVYTEKTAPGANRPDGRPALKEVRTLTKVKTPGGHHWGGLGETKYDRKLVARKEGD